MNQSIVRAEYFSETVKTKFQGNYEVSKGKPCCEIQKTLEHEFLKKLIHLRHSKYWKI